MATLTVHNLPDDVDLALRARAAEHGCSLEAEVLVILENAVKPAERLKMGSALAGLGFQTGLTNQDFDDLDQACVNNHKLINLAGLLTRPGQPSVGIDEMKPFRD